MDNGRGHGRERVESRAFLLNTDAIRKYLEVSYPIEMTPRSHRPKVVGISSQSPAGDGG